MDNWNLQCLFCWRCFHSSFLIWFYSSTAFSYFPWLIIISFACKTLWCEFLLKKWPELKFRPTQGNYKFLKTLISTENFPVKTFVLFKSHIKSNRNLNSHFRKLSQKVQQMKPWVVVAIRTAINKSHTRICSAALSENGSKINNPESEKL